MRIPFNELYTGLLKVLLKCGFTAERATLCASVFAENSLDGVYSHGLNKFPLFIEFIKKGYVQVHAHPEKKESFGSWERWEGNLGPGILNAHTCTNRSIALAKEYGMGCVALSNTNHWMRGGTYGWMAAEANCIGICFTNTLPNMPPWGGTESRIGNNPLVIAIPRDKGHMIFDSAMSLYSYGKMHIYDRKNQQLPFEGGFDTAGILTRNPGEILKTQRPLPIGYWKGSGISIMLDMLVAILSGGKATADVGKMENEYGLSQVFICFDAQKTNNAFVNKVTAQLVDYIKSSPLANPDEAIYYPGERTLLTRKENTEKGIPVDEAIWQEVLKM